MPTLILRIGKRPLERNAYYVVLSLLWAYSMVWVLVLLSVPWETLGWMARLFAAGCAALAAPDVHTLFWSYSRYRLWAQEVFPDNGDRHFPSSAPTPSAEGEQQ